MKKIKLAVFFPHDTGSLRKDIADGVAPRERMYGLLGDELGERFSIEYCDSRFHGFSGLYINKAKKIGLNPIDILSIWKVFKADVVVVKDSFSFSISLLAKIFNRPIVYYDSLFYVSKNVLRYHLDRLCIKWADKILCYSVSQANKFAKYGGVRIDKFQTIKFVLDLDFYKKYINNSDGVECDEGYVLSVGRDIGRDYLSLVRACQHIKYPLKIVTLPYLLDGIEYEQSSVDVYENVTYSKLFELYKKCSVVVVPLKSGLDYPSGLRAVLEACCINKCVIISETEYVSSEIKPFFPRLIYYKPEDVEHLEECIREAISFAVCDKQCTGEYPRDYQQASKQVIQILLRLYQQKHI